MKQSTHPQCRYAKSFPLYTALGSEIITVITQLLGSLLNEFVELHLPSECAKLGVKNCDQSNERSVYRMPGTSQVVQLVRHENKKLCPAARADGAICPGTFGPKAYPT